MVMSSAPLVPAIVSVPLNTDADADGLESANADWIGSAPSAPMARVADAAIPTGPMLSFERMVMTCPLSARDRRVADHQQKRGSPDGSFTRPPHCEVRHDQECTDVAIFAFGSFGSIETTFGALTISTSAHVREEWSTCALWSTTAPAASSGKRYRTQGSSTRPTPLSVST